MLVASVAFDNNSSIMNHYRIRTHNRIIIS